MKKHLTFLMAVLLVLGALTGCMQKSNGDGGTAGGSTSGKNKTLTVWWWGEQEAPGAKEWMGETVKAFEEKNPGVKVETVLQTIDGVYPAFETAAQAKKGPDVQFLWGGVFSLGYAWKGYLEPLDKYIPESEWSNYFNWQENTYDDHLWSAPWYTEAAGFMIYNKSLFKQAGLDAEQPPKTWEEFLKACKALKEKNITPIALGAQDGLVAGWLSSTLGNQKLDSVNDLIQAQVKGDVSDPKYSEWLTKLEELNKNGYINANAMSVKIYQGQAEFTEGKAAMTWLVGSQIKDMAEKLGSDNVGLMLTPIFGEGKMAGTVGSTSASFGIPSFAKNKELAAEFIQFTHTKERLESFYKMTGTIPMDKRFSDSIIESPHIKQLWNWINERPDAYTENFLATQIDSGGVFVAVQDILSGTKTAGEAAKFLQTIVEKWRSQNPSELKNFEKWKVDNWR